MIVRAGSGWQTVLADLSLILFMVTASVVNTRPAPEAAAPAPLVLPALGDPVALWRAEPGAMTLAEWLEGAGTDPRLRLTIIAPPTESAGAITLSGKAGRPARILIEPGVQGVFAALTYDQAAPVAQDLRPSVPKETAR